MKTKIHSKLYKYEVTCSSCKFKDTIVSTKQDIHIDVCYKCHPFYTKKDYGDRAVGRVDRFKRKYGLK